MKDVQHDLGVCLLLIGMHLLNFFCHPFLTVDAGQLYALASTDKVYFSPLKPGCKSVLLPFVLKESYEAAFVFIVGQERFPVYD
jgi:hypothetical protein